MVPTAEELEQVTGPSVPTEAIDEGKNGPDELVTEAPVLDATEVAVKETEAPSAQSEAPVKETEAPTVYTEEPVKETEAPSVYNEASTEQTEAPFVHPETPAEDLETPVDVTDTPAENTVAGDTVETEGAPESTPEAAGNAEDPETALTNTADEPAFKAETGQVIETERDEVEVEDSEGEILQRIMFTIFSRCYYSELSYSCALSSTYTHMQ